jgi:hypothetical protein
MCSGYDLSVGRRHRCANGPAEWSGHGRTGKIRPCNLRGAQSRAMERVSYAARIDQPQRVWCVPRAPGRRMHRKASYYGIRAAGPLLRRALRLLSVCTVGSRSIAAAAVERTGGPRRRSTISKAVVHRRVTVDGHADSATIVNGIGLAVYG